MIIISFGLLEIVKTFDVIKNTCFSVTQKIKKLKFWVSEG